VGDTDSYPRGRKVQGGREVAIKAKGGDGSSHRRLGDFLRRGCTPGFVSSRFSRGFARAQETYAFSPLRDTFLSIFLRANCTKMQAMRHRDASTSRCRVAGIRCERSEYYYACEKYAGEKNRSRRAEFSKILARKDFRDRFFRWS